MVDSLNSHGAVPRKRSWQTMSVPIPLIGKATKWRQLCQPIRAKPYSSLREMTSPNQKDQRPLYIVANKSKRLLVKENVFLDLFAMVFEEHNFKKVA